MMPFEHYYTCRSTTLLMTPGCGLLAGWTMREQEEPWPSSEADQPWWAGTEETTAARSTTPLLSPMTTTPDTGGHCTGGTWPRAGSHWQWSRCPPPCSPAALCDGVVIGNMSDLQWRLHGWKCNFIDQCSKFLNKIGNNISNNSLSKLVLQTTIEIISWDMEDIEDEVEDELFNNTGEPDCHYIHSLTHVSMVIAYEYRVIHLISWSIPLFSWLVKMKNVGF